MNTPDRNFIIKATDLSLQSEGAFILKNINFTCRKGEAWAIVGPSGSGKTMLGKILTGHLKASSGHLQFQHQDKYQRVFVSQQHNFREYSTRSYYQQRFDHNYGSDSPLVEEQLLSYLKEENTSSPDAPSKEELYEMAKKLRIDHLFKRRLIELSNGEGKRLQLAAALLQHPQLIVLDHPFLGLDKEARNILHNILNELAESDVTIFLITSPGEVPEKISYVMELEKGEISGIYLRENFIASYKTPEETKPVNHRLSIKELYPEEESNFTVVVEMKNVKVSYGDKTILENIDWKILKGDRWSLSGPNGSGKSTLLSLITGDNPQAYGNDLWLFDKKKGSGESIWEIKRKIGYISPELHIYYQRDLSFTESLSAGGENELSGYGRPSTTAFEAVASGFNDQVGSSSQISSYQAKQVDAWLQLLGVAGYRNVPLYKISLGNQRLILLGRALVKNPPLLILDEPCQGLDKEQTHRFVSMVDEVCNLFNTTLIYVSHYREDIPASVNKFIELENGKIKNIVT